MTLKDEGVDISGDLGYNKFVECLESRQFKSLFCNNLLMNLQDNARANVIRILPLILARGGYMVLNASSLFPYTPDPYDSYFRPTLEELISLFPMLTPVWAQSIQSDGSFLKTVRKNPIFGLKTLVRLATHFNRWKRQINYFPNLNQNYTVACVILKKKE